jgi:uncharacterized protein YjbI with pentapeptide repeats
MAKLTRELLLQIIKSARSRGQKPKLLGANLAETESLRAKARESKLSEAKIRRATLNGAELARLDLREMDLSGVELIGANLSEANLSREGGQYRVYRARAGLVGSVALEDTIQVIPLLLGGGAALLLLM